MRKINVVLVLAMLLLMAFAGPSAAAMYVHDQTTAVSIFPADVTAATHTSNDINIRKYYGQGKLVLDAEAQGSGITTIVKVQQSALATGESVTYIGDDDLDLNLSTSGTPTIAASFTQSGARQVKYVDLILKKHGTIATDKVLTLTINSDESSAPSTTIDATAVTVLANGISSTNYQTVRFTFTTPFDLADATVYWVTLAGNYAASDTNYISWSVATVASGGTAATYEPSTWTAVTTQRPLFKTYQYNFADVVTFTTVGNTAALLSSAIDLGAAGIAIRGVSTTAGGSATGAKSLVLIAPSRP